MKKLQILIVLALFILTTASLQAQEYTKKVVNKLPELEAGKVYTGKDVRASKALFPDGVALGKREKLVYPFAKLTGRKVVVILYYTWEQNGEIIYMSATALRKKTMQPTNVSHYLYTHGKVGKATYTSTLSVNKKGVISFNEIENGKQKTSRYRIEGKRFSFVSN